MKNKVTKRILFAVFAIALCVAAYFAADLAFFQYDDPLERASLTIVNDGEDLSFTYDNDAITLHGGDNTTVYALTYGGTAVVTDAYTENLPSDFMGSFAAVQTDGNVTRIAKTDMEYTQGYTTAANLFLSDEIPFEVAYADREYFTVYFNGEPLSNAEITVTLSDGSQKTVTTDKSGNVTDLDLNDVRGGLSFTYISDTQNTYILHYQVEADTIFTARWLSAMLPFGIIILISVVCIVLDVFLRKLLYQKEKMPVGKTAITAKDTRKKRILPGFETVRWIVMILSFALLIFGSRLTGTVFSNVQLPVLACPYNLDQLTSAGCYYFSHPDVLFTEGWQEILAFFGTFIVCAVLLGRVLCGFICPLGFVQDVAHEARQALHIEGVSLNEKMYTVLRLVKWIMLVIFLGIGFVGGNFCDFCPAAAISPALAGFKLSLGLGGFFMIIVIVSGFFKRRSFCNICPLGYILGLTHKASLFKLKKDAVACTECGACYEACPMGIKSIFTVREGKKGELNKIDVTTPDCIMCGECVRRCPENNALAITFCGKKVYNADRMKFMKQYAPKPDKYAPFLNHEKSDKYE